jgi:hypothetical protein
MTKTFVVALLPACALAGSALVAAPGQTYPGQPTQGHVMIDNKGPGQTIPVAVQQIAGDATLRVQVTNTPNVSVAGLPEVRRARQNWEYQRITAATDDDIAPELNRQGAAGWEAAFQYLNSRGGLVVVLKRPRP